MKWWQRLRQRRRDIRTLSKLSLDAERLAGEMNELPGAEHFLLAAFNLSDGTANEAFVAIGVDPEQFRAAIDEQYDDALRAIGIEPNEVITDETANDSSAPTATLYKAKPDVSTLYKRMHEFDKSRPDKPLLGATVVVAIATFEQGVTARALRVMNVDRDALAKSARSVVDGWAGPVRLVP